MHFTISPIYVCFVLLLFGGVHKLRPEPLRILRCCFKPRQLNGLAILGQLLLCALLAAGSDGPGKLVRLGGILVSGQDLGVLTSFDLQISQLVSTTACGLKIDEAYSVDEVVHLGLVWVVTCTDKPLYSNSHRRGIRDLPGVGMTSYSSDPGLRTWSWGSP
jgi:hypothetical protein